MGSLVLPLPVLAIVLAAADAMLVRWAQPWRAAEVGLFFHAYFLWACFGLVALWPARLTLRFLDARSRPWPAPGYDARPWIVLLGWMVLPVAVQATLDGHTALVGLGGLAHARPWLELGGALAGGLAFLALLGRFLANVPGVRTASVGVALAFGAGLSLPSRRAPAPEASNAPHPNLLVLVWDTCRADKLEPYGQTRRTSPHLAELAEQSLVFEDSLSVSTFTFTSHLSLLTGVHPSTHGAHLGNMRFDPARASSSASLLAAAGYRTGAFVGTDVLAGRTGIRTGFEVYDDQVDPGMCDTLAWRCVHALQALAAQFVPALRFNGRPHWIQDFQRPGDEVLARAAAWIRREDPRPWFCFVNLYDVHWPYVPEQGGKQLVRPYDGPVDGFLFRSDRWQPGYAMRAADRQHVDELYEGEVFDLDALVAGFLDGLALERGGTAVLVTSDHGEGLGEGDTWNHDDVREPQVRVPLILRLPEPSPRGARVRAPVSGIDVAPTLLTLAGIEPPAGMEGRSLLDMALQTDAAQPEDTGGEPARERWVDDRDHVRAQDFRCVLYRDTFKLVRFGQGAGARYELYDLASDPAGFTDVQARHPELFARLVARMEERTADGDRGGSDDVRANTGDSASALRALGYAGD